MNGAGENLTADARSGDADSKGQSSSADRVLDVIEYLALRPGDGVTASELSRDTGISRTSVYRVLTTLEARQWAVKTDRIWAIGPRAAELSGLTPQSTSLIERARPCLVRLWEEFGETVNLGVPSRDEVLYLDILESVRGLRTAVQVGSRDALHATALGKVFLASRPTSDVRRLLDGAELPRRTPRTIVALAPLMRELAEVASRGWALDNEESEIGVRCVAVPLRDREGRTVAAVSLSAPTVRFGDDRIPAVVEAVIDEVGRISE